MTKIDGGLNQILNDSSFYKFDGRNTGIFFKNVVENGLITELIRN
jgi:hypothetical protein